jgi:hypothetical protein
MTTVKYINGIDEVIRLNKKAIKADYNRALEIPNFIDGVCELAGASSPQVWNYKFIVTREGTFVHNDSEMRVTFIMGTKPRRYAGGQKFKNGDMVGELVTIDMSFEDYEALPSLRY